MRYLVVGRHNFTPVQVKLLEAVGLIEEVARVEQVDNAGAVISMAKEVGAEAIVVQALPMHLLAQLLQAAIRADIPVYGFRIETVGLYQTREEAEEVAKRVGADILLPSREGTWRVARTAALQQLKRIIVEAEDVVRTEDVIRSVNSHALEPA